MKSLLNKIESPKDLKELTRYQLPELSKELREYILESVAKTGGHLSSNLGTVELTVALHYIFIHTIA
ncbi:1-deoxy-D-xylulose-5-phosphate synthase [Oligella ureolytica]